MKRSSKRKYIKSVFDIETSYIDLISILMVHCSLANTYVHICIYIYVYTHVEEYNFGKKIHTTFCLRDNAEGGLCLTAWNVVN